MSHFSKNLRSLRKEANMRQQDLADELGVAQTTIASYEQDQRFPNHETLIEIADFFNVSIDFLLGRDDSKNLDMNSVADNMAEKMELNDIAKSYLNALITGKSHEADQIIFDALNDNWTLKDLYLDVLEPVLINIGILWETNRIDVFQEHFMSNNIYALLDKLKDRYPEKYEKKKKNKNILLLSVSGEHHQIGLRMINNLLEINGWNTFYLGSNIPNRSVLNAIKNYEADLVMLSVTIHEHLNPARNLIQTIRNNSDTRDVKIMVGGAAFQKYRWQDLGADAYALNAEEAVEKVEEMLTE
jgi:methanogenic corrinoid protein MtbC1